MADDPLVSQQWVVYNASRSDVTLNLRGAWLDYSGRGTRIAVVDDGVDYLHPDLAANYDTSSDWDAIARDDDAFPDWSFQGHGTLIAGVIGAVAGNAVGMAGVAYGATIAGFRKGAEASLTVTQLTEIFERQSAFDVSNNSWLYTATRFFDGLDGELAPAAAAMLDAATNGRDGLGTIFVFPSGNNAASGHRADYHGFQASPWTVTVAGIAPTGAVPSFSNPGASVLVAAGSVGVLTTDRRGAAGYVDGDYVSSIAGTSLSAAQVSGVVALMLEANPDLGLRDVHEILAYAAWNPASSMSGWQVNGAGNWNGGGLAVSDSYGFGLTDALAAVRLAETWQTSRTVADVLRLDAVSDAPASIADGGSLSQTVTVSTDVDIDRVLLSLDVSHGHIGDLIVRLTSPAGTTSTFVDRPGRTATDPDGLDQEDLRFTFSSVQFWGESGVGTWTVTVSDALGNGVGGSLNGWGLTLFGDAPSDDDTYFYTREWLRHADLPERGTLVDSSGVDTLNLAALDGDFLIDLEPGATSDLLGKSLRIGNDTLIENAVGGDGANVIRGNDGDNRLEGGRGDDRLEGRGGDDTLVGGKGADILVGGAGIDVADYASAGSAIFVRLWAGFGAWGDAEGDTLFEVENLLGSAFDDLLGGDAGDNRIEGADGDDLVSGNAGNDLLVGGRGADMFDGGEGIDTADYSTASGAVFVRLWAGSGLWSDAEGDRLVRVENLVGSAFDDMLGGDASGNRIDGGAGADVIYGNEGDDWLAGGTGSDELQGLAGNDQLAGDVGDDRLFGGDGDDVLHGGSDADRLWGGDGDDRLAGGAGADWFDGYNGDDSLDYGASPEAVTVLLWEGTGRGGDAEGDTIIRVEGLIGSAFADRLEGNGSDNHFVGGAGADLMDGKGGTDTVDYSASTGAVQADLTTQAGSGGHAAGDRLVKIENVIGSAFGDRLIGQMAANDLDGGSGDDVLGGRGGSDILRGGAGADYLDGSEGDDLLVGGVGADILNGGSGIDTADYSDAVGGVFVRLWAGQGQWSDAEGDRLGGIEDLVGSSFDDLLAGDARANRILGGDGSDVVNGHDGDDRLAGGQGSDTVDGGEGFDTADYSDSAAAVAVRLWSGVGSGGDAEGDRLFGIEQLLGSRYGDILAGAATGEVLIGGGGDDLLSGHAGDDRLEGGAGFDRLIGGAGADILIGGENTDTADYSSGAGPVVVGLWNGIGRGGDAEGDRLQGIEILIGSAYDDGLAGDAEANRIEGFNGDDTIDGKGGNDRLIGGNGSDVLDGEAGDDRLIGGAGADSLIGGEGVDVADYSEASGPVFVRLWAGEGQWSEAQGDRLTGIENVIGTAFDDALAGDGGDNIIEGGAGDDIVNGHDGDDRLLGGAGADVIGGGLGEDTADYSQSSAGVFVRLWAGDGQWGDAEGDRLSGIENLRGSRFADALAGDDGANRIDGGRGSDVVNGHGGDDWLIGGDGRYDGGDGIDTIDYSTYPYGSGVFVRLWLPGGDVVNVENVIGSNDSDKIGGDDNANRLDGGAGNDLINGHGGDDVILGGSGTDFLSGNAGSDELYGGAGRDRFYFSDGDGSDRIMDFEDGDQLDFALVSQFDSYQAVLDAAYEDDAGVRIAFDGGSVTLIGAALSDLKPDMLFF